MSVKLTFEARSDVGLERSENQDAFGSKRLDGLEFFVVCDGMGGHAGGSTASRLAVMTIENLLESLSLPVQERIRKAVEAANAAIHTKSEKRRELRGMGTTAVLLAIDHSTDSAIIAHVGDSRLYHLRGDIFRRVTKDHTLVQRLLDDGILTPEAAANHPNSNVISRSLGSRAEVDVEFQPEPLPLEDGDIFVLCSDGLHGLVEEEEIARIISTLPPDMATARLIERANEEGGHDNITVEIILIGDQRWRPGGFTIVHPPSGPGNSREPRAVPGAYRDPPAGGAGVPGAPPAAGPGPSSASRSGPSSKLSGALMPTMMMDALPPPGASIASMEAPQVRSAGPSAGLLVIVAAALLSVVGVAAWFFVQHLRQP